MLLIILCRMMPGAVPLRGPPGQGPRAGAAMRGPMGRGDYGKCFKKEIFLLLYSLNTVF